MRLSKWIASAAFSLCLPAHASVSYVYSGAPYIYFAGIAEATAFTQFQFTVSEPLAALSTFHVASSVWSAKAGSQVFDPSTAANYQFYALPLDTVTTDAFGSIQQWTIQATYHLRSGPIDLLDTLSFQDSGSIDFRSFQGLDGMTNNTRVGISYSQYELGTDVAGTWLAITTPVTEPASAAMLALGLMGLGLAIRRPRRP
jgi:hypothetical protein